MYHDRSYRLLDIAPAQDDSASRRFADTEQRLNIALPSSLQEWYRRGDAISILLNHSNDDPPIEPHNFKLFSWQSRALLPIRYENQGVCTWAVDLDGSSDPPVLVDVDTNGKLWIPFADTFSDYVYTGVWDYKRVLGQRVVVQAQNSPLTSTTIASLQSHFDHEVLTHGWPGGMQYRFGNSEGALLIWSEMDQASWFAGAATTPALKSLLQSIWTLDDVGRTFWECSDEGRDVLADIRA